MSEISGKNYGLFKYFVPNKKDDPTSTQLQLPKTPEQIMNERERNAIQFLNNKWHN